MGRPKQTQSRLAAQLKLSTAMVSKLVARGMPLDLDGAVEWRKTHLQPVMRKGVRTPGGAGDARLADVRLARERTQHRIAELRLGEIEGRLLDKGVHDRAMRLVATAVIDNLATLENRMAPRLEPHQRKALSDEVRAYRERCAAIRGLQVDVAKAPG
jgi:hypothetical protein